jgi:hypothetical protein
MKRFICAFLLCLVSASLFASENRRVFATRAECEEAVLNDTALLYRPAKQDWADTTPGVTKRRINVDSCGLERVADSVALLPGGKAFVFLPAGKEVCLKDSSPGRVYDCPCGNLFEEISAVPYPSDPAPAPAPAPVVQYREPERRYIDIVPSQPQIVQQPTLIQTFYMPPAQTVERERNNGLVPIVAGVGGVALGYLLGKNSNRGGDSYVIGNCNGYQNCGGGYYNPHQGRRHRRDRGDRRPPRGPDYFPPIYTPPPNPVGGPIYTPPPNPTYGPPGNPSGPPGYGPPGPPSGGPVYTGPGNPNGSNPGYGQPSGPSGPPGNPNVGPIYTPPPGPGG